MLGDATIGLLAASHNLLLPHLQAAMDVLRRTVFVLVEPLQGHKLLIVPHAQHVDAAAVAATETQEMDGVQHIRLALTVAADEAIQLGREVQFGLGNVLIIEYG